MMAGDKPAAVAARQPVGHEPNGTELRPFEKAEEEGLFGNGSGFLGDGRHLRFTERCKDKFLPCQGKSGGMIPRSLLIHMNWQALDISPKWTK
jgi:hypothetical protein